MTRADAVQPSQPLEPLSPRTVGISMPRVDGHAKVMGTAPYAWEHDLRDPAYVYPLQAAIPRGRVRKVDAARAEAIDGVIAVLTPRNAARLADTGDAEMAVLQSDEVAFRGQLIGAVVAETP
jgi:xanthine dehydrogenase YagR molybdenum-binding subunit